MILITDGCTILRKEWEANLFLKLENRVGKYELDFALYSSTEKMEMLFTKFDFLKKEKIKIKVPIMLLLSWVKIEANESTAGYIYRVHLGR